MSDQPFNVVFAEEDTLFRLMEMALLRELTPAGEKTLRYFFGDDFKAPLANLTSMADKLRLPRGIATKVCQNDSELDAALPGADYLVVEASTLDAARVNACAQRTKLIQQFGRSVDNIDLAAARRASVPVANLNRLSSQSSADHITCLVLALARRLIPAHMASLKRRDPALSPAWSDDPPRNKFNWAGVKGFRILAHSTIGFIGLGENSGYVAKRLSNMGMRALYFKRNPLTREDEEALGGVEYSALDELLAQCDFVSLHLPYSPATEKFADQSFFAKMKQGSYLINSARGGVVDERALYEALMSGKLAGAALDVYRYEPLPGDTPLLDLDNVIWTPHMSGGEPEFMIEEGREVLTNIARAYRGETPVGLV